MLKVSNDHGRDFEGAYSRVILGTIIQTMLESMQDVSAVTISREKHILWCRCARSIVKAKLFSAMSPATAWYIILIDSHQRLDSNSRRYHRDGWIDNIHRMSWKPYAFVSFVLGALR